MNFLDPYDITRTTTPNPNQPEQPTLNEEVHEVIGQLGRFWGGFRKQSQTALTAARKDFGEVVVQAQKELSKLSVAPEPPEETAPNDAVERETPPPPAATNPSSSTDEPSASTSEAPVDGDLPPSPTASTGTQGLFSRFQSVLPPNVVSTVRDHLPETLKHASENIDLNHLGTNLLSEFQRVQGVTRAQAEEYVHKSEILLRDAVKEAGEVLRDAVKVVPPEEGRSQSAGASFVWDGSDMWMLPTDYGTESTGGAAEKGTDTSSSTARGKETHTAVATRAEALLKRLKHDPSILRHDPDAEDNIKDEFHRWRASEMDGDGGIESSEWASKCRAALEEPIDGPALKELHGTLVPSELNESAFWLRFFFRSHQIRAEEEKRKALIHSSTDNDEDFTWEDDEEESAGTSTKERGSEVDTPSNASISGKTLKGGLTPSSSGLATGGTTTPRVSSEDSFDMVSSANISVVGDEKAKTKDVDDGGDSDWE